MKNKVVLYLMLSGIIGVLSGCEKDGTQIKMSDNPTAPMITSLPDLTLERASGTDTLEFVCTPVERGFQASATYFLEACLSGDNFAHKMSIYSGVTDKSIKMTEGDLNNIFLTQIAAGTATSVDFRVRSVLTQDAGTGYVPIADTSATVTATVTPYGPPTLSCTTAGANQGITSAADDGIYTGWIYTDGSAFRFTNTDDGKIYGGDPTSGKLTENGDAFSLEAGGYQITVDLRNPSDISIEYADVTIGIIGDAVGGWDNDTKMVWDFSDKSWNIDKSVVAGGIKFRTHGGWANVNIGYRPNDKRLSSLYQSHGSLNNVYIEPDLGDSGNIDDIAAGDYHIKLFLVTSPWSASAEFTPAN